MMPEGWRIVTVDDITAELKSGLSRKLSASDTGLPVLRSNNLIAGSGIDYSDLKYWYVNDPQGANTENYVLRDNDILINFINSTAIIGKCSIYTDILKRNVIYTTNIMCLRVKDHLILPQYFLYLTQTEEYQKYIESITKPAVNQASFTTIDFRNWKFPLPPLPEQHKIAEILSTWDRAIDLASQLIAAKKERKRGLMQQLLTGKRKFTEFEGEEWHRLKLGDLGYCIRGVSYDPGEDLKITDDEDTIRLLRSNNIQSGQIRTDELQFVDSARCRTEQVLIPGDIAICIANGSKDLVGKAAIFRKHEEHRYTVGAFCAIYRTKNHNDQEFINQLFQSGIYRSKLRTIFAGSSINNLKPSDIEALDFEIPVCQEERLNVAEVLQACDREIALLEQKRDLLKQQKQGLMQQLLSGRVRVPVAQAESSS
jgi:type I restriction enzyme, S subunit